MEQSLGGVNGFFLFRMGSRFTVVLGLLGLVLAIVGVYSVISYAASQKTHEIGVRMALGADRRDILKMVLRQGFVLVGAGLIAGLLMTFLAARGIGSLLVGVSPSDPVTLVSVALLLAAVGLMASYIPARRAMNIEPLRALKYENPRKLAANERELGKSFFDSCLFAKFAAKFFALAENLWKTRPKLRQIYVDLRP